MNLDIGTMSFMVSVSNMLHPIILIFFFFVANQYRGIGIYVIGTTLSAMGFIFFLMRSFFPDLLILRFLGNIFIIFAQIFYAVGIGSFVQKKINSHFIILVVTIFILTQFYFIFINHNYFARNISIILTILIFYSFAVYFLLCNRNTSYFISSLFTGILFIIESCFLIFRLIMIIPTRTESLFQSNTLNMMLFWSVFIFDYLRNSGFMIMVSQRLYQDLKKSATTDKLTGLLNRRALEPVIYKEIDRKNRFNHPVSFLIFDLDHFKQINDQYGHAAGDEVLFVVSETVKSIIRSTDSLARWGGEEFVVLAANTNIWHATILAEKIRKAIESIKFENIRTVTASIGVAEYCSGENFQDCYERADSSLYKAKKEGRNRVVADFAKKEFFPKSILKIEWSDDFYSGDTAIDEQHVDLFNQINHIVDSVLSKTDKNTIDAILKKFIISLDKHFAYEEQILEQSKYPKLKKHSEVHKKIRAELYKIVSDFSKNSIDSFILIKFITQELIIGHLVTDDQDYFNWLNSNYI